MQIWMLLTRLSGILILAIVLGDTFEVMLLPVPVKRRVRLVMVFLRPLWGVWCLLACIARPGQRRERALGLFGPLFLVSLILIWIAGLILGFALVQLSLLQTEINLPQAFYVSAATFFTLGIEGGILVSPGAKAASVIEAGCGLGFLALVIGYLPVLYQLYAQREIHVMLLDERAGSPPCAITFLQRHSQGQNIHEVDVLLREWERWSAELLESHMSYPMLSYYRSQFANQSWLAATAAVMDACALIMVGLTGVRTFQARMSFAVTRLVLAELTELLGIQRVALGAVRLPSAEFEKITAILREVGLAFVEPDAELLLAKFRATYEPFLGGLSKHLMLPLPEWIPQEGEERMDNWTNNSRGRIAQQLLEAVAPEPQARSFKWPLLSKRVRIRKSGE